jgi:hypothetical protein
MTTELKEQKFRMWNKSRLHGEKISPRNKSWLEELEEKYSVNGTNHDYRRNKNLGRGIHQA